MEAGFIALIVLVAIVCTLVGIYIGKTRTQQQGVQGVLNVDRSDPQYAPELFLALTVPIEDIVSQKHVVFSVNVIRQNSQK